MTETTTNRRAQHFIFFAIIKMSCDGAEHLLRNSHSKHCKRRGPGTGVQKLHTRTAAGQIGRFSLFVTRSIIRWSPSIIVRSAAKFGVEHLVEPSMRSAATICRFRPRPVPSERLADGDANRRCSLANAPVFFSSFNARQTNIVIYFAQCDRPDTPYHCPPKNAGGFRQRLQSGRGDLRALNRARSAGEHPDGLTRVAAGSQRRPNNAFVEIACDGGAGQILCPWWAVRLCRATWCNPISCASPATGQFRFLGQVRQSLGYRKAASRESAGAQIDGAMEMVF